MVALMDPSLSMKDVDVKLAKVVAARADHVASLAASKEAEERARTAAQLHFRTPPVMSAEEYRGALLTRDKYREEAASKAEAVKVAQAELESSEIVLRQHALRNE